MSVRAGDGALGGVHSSGQAESAVDLDRKAVGEQPGEGPFELVRARAERVEAGEGCTDRAGSLREMLS